jgi:hypothetical protein
MSLESELGLRNNEKVMEMPKIEFGQERGAQLFSLLLKAKDFSWGETETKLSKYTVDYVKKNPINNILLKTIEDFETEGVDEETMYNMALTYENSQRKEKYGVST